jgi:tripartite-type tricarboxylate transporter receptor subunit TctC
MNILGYRTGGMLMAAASLLMPISAESIAQQARGGVPAEGYPAKPIRWLVDGGSGGLSDTIARAVGQKLTEVWGRPIVHDARPGASGTIAYELGARAPADGYTLLSVSAPFLINDLVYDKLPYDTRKDFAPIGLTAAYSLVLVTNLKVPAKTVAELVAYAKSKPGAITWATTGPGTSPFLATELFRKQAGFDGVHVPYSSSPASLIDLMGGRIDFTLVVMPSAIAHIRARRVHAVAVTSPARSTLLPDIPTVAESGLAGFQSVGYTGVVTQAAVPKSIVAKVNSEIVRTLKSLDVEERILNLGCEPRWNTPEEFRRLLTEELARWAPVAREAGEKLKR